MYCKQCGREMPELAAFCANCGASTGAAAAAGRPAMGNGAAMPAAGPAAGRLAPADCGARGRVARHITVLAVLWLIMGLLRMLPGLFVLAMGGAMSHGMAPWMTHGMGWPGMMPPFTAAVMVVIGWVLLGAGLLTLLTAWVIYQRESWGRIFAIVMAILSLLSFPFGTALGIYTLWVLAPEAARQDWQAMARR